MNHNTRESWVKDYMRMMDDEYGDYGFCDDPKPSDEEFAEDWDTDEESAEGWDYDDEVEDECASGGRSRGINAAEGEESVVPRKVTKLKDIKRPEGIKKTKRDLWMETLRRLEQAARTTTDFRNLGGWYDYLEDLEKDRARKHEILRNGDDYPIEYGENENSTLFSGGLGSVIAKQMRKGDFLDYLYCKPETIDQLVTTDYVIDFMREIKDKDRQLFFYRAVENISAADIAEMKGQTDRAVRKAWKKLITHLKQQTMEELVLRIGKDYSYTGQELEFLNTRREEYEARV